MKTAPLAIAALLACSLVSSSYGVSDLERELKQLMDERDQAISAATAPITARFKTSAERLLQRALQAGDLDASEHPVERS